MNSAPSPMPTTLKIVIGFFALSLCFDAYTVFAGLATTVIWIRIAIGIGIIAGLLRGNDSVRAIVRGFSVLGVIAGVIALLRMVPAIGVAPTGLVATGLAVGLLVVLGSIFTFWALGRESVEAWMARRSFGT